MPLGSPGQPSGTPSKEQSCVRAGAIREGHLYSQQPKEQKKVTVPTPKEIKGSHTLGEGFPDSSVGKESACNVGDLDSIPVLGRFPGDGNGYPFQYSGLENSTDYIVYGVTKSQTRPNDFHFHTLGEEAEPRYSALRGPWGGRKMSQKEMSSQGAEDYPGGISIPSL